MGKKRINTDLLGKLAKSQPQVCASELNGKRLPQKKSKASTTEGIRNMKRANNGEKRK